MGKVQLSKAQQEEAASFAMQAMAAGVSAAILPDALKKVHATLTHQLLTLIAGHIRQAEARGFGRGVESMIGGGGGESGQGVGAGDE